MRGAAVCCFVSGALGLLEMLLFNGPLFDAHEGILAWTRDGATLFEALLLVLLLAVARNRPGAVQPIAFSAAALVAGILGHALCAFGVMRGCAGTIAAGLVCTSASSAWSTVVWLLACSTLEFRCACLCLAGSGLVAAPVGLLFNLYAPYGVLAVVDALCLVGMVVLCVPVTLPVFVRLKTVGTPVEQAILNPRTVLPLGHAFYVYIFGFSLAYGFALRCESIASSGLMTAAMMVVLAAVALYAWRVAHRPRADALFTVAFFAVAVGFMLVLVGDERLEGFAAALLLAGYICSQLLVWFALVAAAARNTVDAIPTICWGTAVGYTGICVGAALWIVPNLLLAPVLGDISLLQGIVVTAVFAGLLLYMLLTRRSFSFDATIEGIAPDAPRVEVHYVDVLDDRCAAVSARCGLTVREAEVLLLLAHGNATAHIQRELGIGANTVKYHVKNIYAKLGVHSQQQLIDLVAQG